MLTLVLAWLNIALMIITTPMIILTTINDSFINACKKLPWTTIMVAIGTNADYMMQDGELFHNTLLVVLYNLSVICVNIFAIFSIYGMLYTKKHESKNTDSTEIIDTESKQ